MTPISLGRTSAGNAFGLPLDLATQTAAILGIRGSGKTSTGVVCVEGLLAARQQVIVVDPMDVWWGLRAGKDGAASGGHAITVLGGEHADLPLEAGGGRVLAEFLVEHQADAILATRHLSKSAQRQLITDFAERVYELKGRAAHRSPLHLVIDEADLFAPQRIFAGQERLFGAVDQLVRRGRSSGIGVTLISQRAAVLNKDVLTQCELLVCHRTIGPQDRKAIEAWVEVHDAEGKAAEVLGSLHKLERGEAWVWSPGWLGLLERVQVRARRTFDSSATPKAGERVRPPKALAPVDLANLRAAMAETVERAKADDPRELRREVAALKRQLAAKPKGAAPAAPATLDAKALRKEFDRGLAASDEEWTLWLARTWDRLETAIETAVGRILGKEFATAPKVRSRPRPAPAAGPSRPAIRSSSLPTARTDRRPRQDVNDVLTSSDPGAPEIGNGGLRRMMIALAQRPGLSARQLGVRAGLSSKSGTFGTYLGRARAAGWIAGGRNKIALTPEGLVALGPFEPLPEGAELLAYWLAELGRSGAGRMLQELAKAWPQALSAEDLAERADLSAGSGTFGTYLGRLRSLELVEGGRDALRAAEELME